MIPLRDVDLPFRVIPAVRLSAEDAPAQPRPAPAHLARRSAQRRATLAEAQEISA